MLRPSAFGGSTVDEQEVDRQSENNDCNNVQQQSNSIPNNNAKVWNPFSNMQDNEDEGIGTESSKNSSSSTNNVRSVDVVVSHMEANQILLILYFLVCE